VQQHKSTGRGRVAGTGKLKTAGVGPRRKAARGRDRFQPHLRARPHSAERDHCFAEDFRGVGQIGHIQNCRSTIADSLAETPLPSGIGYPGRSIRQS
jgi:hypothetical protein